MREIPEGYNPFNRRDLAISGQPTAMPGLSAGQLLVCEYIISPQLPSLNRMFVVESLADMQELYGAYAQGMAVQLKWYICDELNKIMTMDEWTQGRGEQPQA